MRPKQTHETLNHKFSQTRTHFFIFIPKKILNVLYHTLCTNIETSSHVGKFILFDELQILCSSLQSLNPNICVLWKSEVAEICGKSDSHAHMIEQKCNPLVARKLVQDSTKMADTNRDS